MLQMPCRNAVRPLSALRVGSGARYAAPMPNGRFFALRLLVRCAADRRLSALCVGSHVCNAALLSIDCWCILRLLMRRNTEMPPSALDIPEGPALAECFTSSRSIARSAGAGCIHCILGGSFAPLEKHAGRICSITVPLAPEGPHIQQLRRCENTSPFQTTIG